MKISCSNHHRFHFGDICAGKKFGYRWAQWQMVRAALSWPQHSERKSNCGKRCIRGHVSSGGCGCTQRCPDEHRKSCVWTWGVCEWRREGEHMGRRLGQYIPFSESRGECQEPDPKSSAMRSLDSSIKMLHLYHKYPARYIFSFSLALFPSHPLSYGNRQHHNPLQMPAHAYRHFLHKESG